MRRAAFADIGGRKYTIADGGGNGAPESGPPGEARVAAARPAA